MAKKRETLEEVSTGFLDSIANTADINEFAVNLLFRWIYFIPITLGSE